MYTLEQGLVNAGFIFFGLALLSTAILGRWFCGWACHIVALQDFCGWIMKKCGVKPKPFRSRLLRLAPLLLALHMFAWPTFNREVIKPLAGESWPALRPLLGEAPPPVFRSSDSFKAFVRPGLTKKAFWETFEKKWYVVIPFFGICGFAAVYFLGAKGFCTYGCPYGGFFAPLDTLAPARIRVTDACEHCGHCTAVCTSNVRVHEEVRDYGMVVDPGCMKCLDCVSVCPNDALYFGFAPRVEKRKRRPIPPVKRLTSYDLSWSQEIILALLMLGLFLAYRNMIGSIPMLMAIGMAGISTFLAWILWQLIREPSVRLQNLQLKIKGALRPAGAAFGGLAALLLVIGAWSGLVRGGLLAAGLIDDKINTPQDAVFTASYKPSEQDRARADHALSLYRLAGPPSEGGIGWSRSPDDYIRIAWLHAVAGRLDQTEATILRGMDREAAARGRVSFGLIEGLVLVMRTRGQGAPQLAAALEPVVTAHPSNPDLLVVMGNVQMDLGKTERAAECARAAADHAPADPQVALGAANILLQAKQASAAEAALRPAIAEHPEDPELPFALGFALAFQNKPSEALDQFKRAFALNPRNAGAAQQIAQLLQALNRGEEAAEWARKAHELAATTQPPAPR
jgi:polyferredoxin/tetratricopeptide (TPR) repeat protein